MKTCHGHYPLDKGLGDLTRLGSEKRLSCTQCMPDRLLSMPPPPTPLMGRPPSEPAGLGWASPVDRATIQPPKCSKYPNPIFLAIATRNEMAGLGNGHGLCCEPPATRRLTALLKVSTPTQYFLPLPREIDNEMRFHN